MILLDSNYNSRQKEVVFVNIEARVQDLWLDKPFGPQSQGQSNF